MSQLLMIKCPSCDETIEVDKITGKVERHFQEGITKKKEGDFFKESLKELRTKEANRSELFDKLKEEKNTRIQKIADRFEIEKEKVKKSPFEKPKNPFDLE